MKEVLKLAIAIFFSLFILQLQAQEKEERHDCINPKAIDLSISESDTTVVFYDEEDKYTFWYNFTAVEETRVNFKVTPVFESDEYQEMLYKYNGSEFCNELVAGELEAFPLMKEDATFQKGQTYYIGVLQLFGEGCGHLLTVNTNGKEQYFFALNNSCNLNMDSLKNQFFGVPETEPVVEKTEEKPVEEVIPSWKGKVFNKKTGKPVEAEIQIPEGRNKKVLSSKDQGFSFESERDSLNMTITGYGYNALDTGIAYSEDSLEFYLEPVKEGEKFIMKKIYFHPNTYAIKQSSFSELKRLKAFLEENKDIVIEIQGHTNSNRRIKRDKRYSHLGDAWNFKGSAKKLSQKRAETIKDILLQEGIEGERVQTEGYGGDRMINEDPKTMQEAMKNIRVEVHVIESQ